MKVLTFFRSTTGTKSGPDTSEKPRLIMNLTIVRVTRILCSFNLGLGQKAGKKCHQD